MISSSTCDVMKYITSSKMSQPTLTVWREVDMVRWAKGEWLYVVKKNRDIDSSHDVDLKDGTIHSKLDPSRS